MPQRVLLIEDEPHIAEAMRFLLARDGWEVEALSDGDLGLRALQRQTPDLVILDLMLPGRSGLEILAAIRADPRTATLPVMMLTAKGQGRDREAAMLAGVNHFMTKPFANADLLAQVRAIMAH